MYDSQCLFRVIGHHIFVCAQNLSVPLPPRSTATCSLSHLFPWSSNSLQAQVVPPSGINQVLASGMLDAVLASASQPGDPPFAWCFCLLLQGFRMEHHSTGQGREHPLKYQKIRIVQPRCVGEFTPLGQTPTTGKQETGGSLAHTVSLHCPCRKLCGGTIYLHSLCPDIHRHPKQTHVPSDLLCLFLTYCKTLSRVTLHRLPCFLPYLLCPQSHSPGFTCPQRSVST